ncbi:MAG: 3'-5' exonuclease [Flavobacteriaceae bacterium]
MLSKLKLEYILFLDIETVPEVEHFSDLSSEKQDLWAQKSQYQRKDDFSPEEYYHRAGIWAEFGKIICISLGYFAPEETSRSFRITTISGKEDSILKQFKSLLETHFNHPKHLLCAHNGKEFDFPYIARRMLIHNIKLPSKLNLFGEKPWEVPHLDTLELWKFGDYKHYTSLKLMTNVLDIPSPKDDIDGSEIFSVYYNDNDIHRIIDYCQKDTLAVAQILLRLRGEALLEQHEITYI